MHNITLRNIQQYDTILPVPGVVRCNETNPCTGFVFENVKSHGIWTWLGFNYITEQVVGVVTDSKPVPAFIGVDQAAFETRGALHEIFLSWVKTNFDALAEASNIAQVIEATRLHVNRSTEAINRVKTTLQSSLTLFGIF